MLYFAYGSNLNHFQMKRRCKDSLFLKKMNLKDFKLTFRSKYRAADIEKNKNSLVPGGLFEISKSDEKNSMFMRIIQLYIRNIIFIIMEKSYDLYNE